MKNSPAHIGEVVQDMAPFVPLVKQRNIYNRFGDGANGWFRLLQPHCRWRATATGISYCMLLGGILYRYRQMCLSSIRWSNNTTRWAPCRSAQIQHSSWEILAGQIVMCQMLRGWFKSGLNEHNGCRWLIPLRHSAIQVSQRWACLAKPSSDDQRNGPCWSPPLVVEIVCRSSPIPIVPNMLLYRTEQISRGYTESKPKSDSKVTNYPSALQ